MFNRKRDGLDYKDLLRIRVFWDVFVINSLLVVNCLFVVNSLLVVNCLFVVNSLLGLIVCGRLIVFCWLIVWWWLIGCWG